MYRELQRQTRTALFKESLGAEYTGCTCMIHMVRVHDACVSARCVAPVVQRTCGVVAFQSSFDKRVDLVVENLRLGRVRQVTPASAIGSRPGGAMYVAMLVRACAFECARARVCVTCASGSSKDSSSGCACTAADKISVGTASQGTPCSTFELSRTSVFLSGV